MLARFGERLPYLMKVLAIAAPLSLQVHPSAAQAADGYAREQAEDVPPELANYRDGWPKPELLCALTDVHALCGFRPMPDALRLLDLLDVSSRCGRSSGCCARSRRTPPAGPPWPPWWAGRSTSGPT